MAYRAWRLLCIDVVASTHLDTNFSCMRYCIWEYDLGLA